MQLSVTWELWSTQSRRTSSQLSVVSPWKWWESLTKSVLWCTTPTSAISRYWIGGLHLTNYHCTMYRASGHGLPYFSWVFNCCSHRHNIITLIIVCLWCSPIHWWSSFGFASWVRVSDLIYKNNSTKKLSLRLAQVFKSICRQSQKMLHSRIIIWRYQTIMQMWADPGGVWSWQWRQHWNPEVLVSDLVGAHDRNSLRGRLCIDVVWSPCEILKASCTSFT